MPFKTRYGSHYHEVEGCCGATEPCSSTEGLAPCSICCAGARKSADAGGGIAGGIGAGAGEGDYAAPESDVSIMTNAVTRACDDGDQVVLADGSIIQFREAHEIRQDHDGYVIEDPVHGSFVRFASPEDLAEAARQLESGEAGLGSGEGWDGYKSQAGDAMSLSAMGARHYRSSAAPMASADDIKQRLRDWTGMQAAIGQAVQQARDARDRTENDALAAARSGDPSARVDPGTGLPACFTKGRLAEIGSSVLVDDDGEVIPALPADEVARYVRHAIEAKDAGDIDMDVIKRTVAVDRRMRAYATMHAQQELEDGRRRIAEMEADPTASRYQLGQLRRRVRQLETEGASPTTLWDISSGDAFPMEEMDGADGPVLGADLGGDMVLTVNEREAERRGGLLPMSDIMRRVAESEDSDSAFNDFYEAIEFGYPTDWMVDRMLELGTLYEGYPEEEWIY